MNRQSGSQARVVVLGIDDEELLLTLEKWLGKWVKNGNGELLKEGWMHRVNSPSGLVLFDKGGEEAGADTVFPVGSKWGAWELAIWQERRTVVTFQEEVLMVTGGVVLGCLLLGLGGFFVLRRSVKLAMQRASFVNQVSHELRTPVTNLMLNLDLAKDSVEGNGMATRRLGVMGEELGRLQRLLENVRECS